jgi:hypothetical protein
MYFSEYIVILQNYLPNYLIKFLTNYSQEMTRLLRNPEIYYRFQKKASLKPILSQMNKDYTFSFYIES